jgi:acyl-CoA synthetase (AMP-forming)/AMP-acid ligase II
MKGYWRRPDATAEVLDAAGWFRTGDMGRVDDEGYFFVVDRKKQLVIRAGYNVYPREVEEVLYEHPPSARPRSSASPTQSSARRSAPPWPSRTAPPRPPPSRATTSRSASPPTITRAWCGSSTSFRRGRREDPQARDLAAGPGLSSRAAAKLSAALGVPALSRSGSSRNSHVRPNAPVMTAAAVRKTGCSAAAVAAVYSS